MIRSDPLSAAVSPYRRRLGLFAALKAFIAGTAAGAFAAGTAVLIMKILQRSGYLLPVLVVFASGFVIAGTAVLLLCFPGYNYTARKLDSLGLKERTSTMLALSGSPTEIAALQRIDALTHIGMVKKEQLREKISSLSLVLCAAAIIFALACALIPASLFERAQEDTEAQVWQDVLEMLREEQQRLEAQGEEALSDEMIDLIDKLEQGESVLNAVGDINTAEQNAVDDVLNGEATPRAAREMIDVLEEAKRMLLDLEESESGEGEGELEILIPGEGGEEEEGEASGEGEAEGEGEEENGEGNRPGEGPEGEPNENGESGPGHSTDGEESDSVSNMTEKIYDPISGTVQYGDVFSVYLADYLREAENGDIPFELKDASDTYFNSLDR